MAEKDVGMKNYLKCKLRFADLINGTIYNGKQIVKEDDLSEQPNEYGLILEDKKGKKQVVQRYRDIVMKAKTGEYYIVFPVENQMNVHYAMPVRMMLYDALAYAEQVKELERKHEKNGEKLKGAEFLSGMKKEDKLIPIVPIVVYYGSVEWDASQDIHSMLELDDSLQNEELKKYVPNYKINLLNVGNVECPENYKSGLQQLFGMLKCKSDKTAMRNYIDKHKEKLSSVDAETFRLLGNLLGNAEEFEKYQKEENGGIDMCRAFDEIYKEEQEKGRIQGSIEILLDLLKEKGEISDKLLEKITESTDVDVVKKWIKIAAKSLTIEEFEKNI